METKTSSNFDEKNEPGEHSSSQTSPHQSPTRLEKGSKSAGVFLSEEEALAKARIEPNSTCPIYVTFGKDDPSNPRNFANWKKWYITCLVSFTNVLTCLCAGGYSSGANGIAAEFGVSSEVITVGLSMYILGFAIGPLLLAPLSEYYGRSPVYFGAWFILVIFQLPLALAPNIGTIIVCRFIAGLGGSAPLTNTGGTISDLFERNLSGNAMRIYGVSSTFGPPFALMISGYVGQNEGWRAIFWMFMGVTGGIWIIMLLTLPETRHSTILEKKAQRVRKILVKEGHANAPILEHIGDAHGKGEKRSMHTLFATNLTRPLRFLCTEPITLGAAAYNGFIYGIVYLFNESVPLVFGKNHGFSVGEQGLAFTGIAVGVLIAAAFHPLQERYYLRKVSENDGKGVPEARMYQARFGAFLLPISFFWFAWTSYSSVPWIVPIIASSLFGAGQYIVVLGILNYVVDSYQSYSASALAGVILVRNTVGAGFPLFGKQMYTTLGYEWAGSLLGFLSLLFIPIVWWWFYKGESLRMKSPWAREHFYQDEDSPH